MVTGAVSVETAQTPSLSQRVPATRGTKANTVSCALPRSRLPVLPVAPRSMMHFRNGVSEHVSLQTAQTPSLSQRVPATQNKKPPCNNTWWTGIKRTVQSPPLCLHRECRLRHAPTVVAGSSMDCCCTRDQKGKVSGVWRRGADRATKEGKASGRSDRHCHLPSASGEGQGRLRTSRCPSRRTRRRRVPVSSNTRRRKRQYLDAGPPCQRRTRWLAGPASVTS